MEYLLWIIHVLNLSFLLLNFRVRGATETCKREGFATLFGFDFQKWIDIATGMWARITTFFGLCNLPCPQKIVVACRFVPRIIGNLVCKGNVISGARSGTTSLQASVRQLLYRHESILKCRYRRRVAPINLLMMFMQAVIAVPIAWFLAPEYPAAKYCWVWFWPVLPVDDLYTLDLCQ